MVIRVCWRRCTRTTSRTRGRTTTTSAKSIKVGGKNDNVVSLTGIPIGPTWHSKFLLGADPNGRDVAVRLLYGGRNSLEIG